MIKLHLSLSLKHLKQKKCPPFFHNFSFLCLIIYFLTFLNLFLSPDVFGLDWQETKGDHFIVYYNGDEHFASDMLKKAETCYQQIAFDLGYVRYDNFWQWDNRVKIFIFPDKDSYLKATGQPSWSSGCADHFKREILGFSNSKGFLNEILPHEIAHLIFRDFVGFKGKIPLWLDEGVAQWQERSKRRIVKYLVLKQYIDEKFIPLAHLTKMDIRNLQDAEIVQNFYVEALSLVGFIIEKYGTDRFTQFCRQLRDGKSLNEALSFTYPTDINSMNELEKKWIEYITAEPDSEVQNK